MEPNLIIAYNGYSKGAFFGGTDIAGAILRGCVYNTLSCFSLDFITCADLRHSCFLAQDDTPCSFSCAPMVIKGLHDPLILLDKVILLGHQILKRETRTSFTNLALLQGYCTRLEVIQNLAHNLQQASQHIRTEHPHTKDYAKIDY